MLQLVIAGEHSAKEGSPHMEYQQESIIFKAGERSLESRET